MTNSAKRRSKPSPHSFRISGGSGRLLKEPVEVCFKPLPKRYPPFHAAKTTDRGQ